MSLVSRKANLTATYNGTLVLLAMKEILPYLRKHWLAVTAIYVIFALALYFSSFLLWPLGSARTVVDPALTAMLMIASAYFGRKIYSQGD
jgi:hypothetical protein